MLLISAQDIYPGPDDILLSFAMLNVKAGNTIFFGIKEVTSDVLRW